MPFKFNAPRRHRIPKARYRVRNWSAYEAGLRRRGDLTLWIDEAALDKWQAPPQNTPGGQANLALRQAEAFASSVLRLLGLDLPIPDHTTLSRRSGEFATRRPSVVARARHLVVDSTGLRISDKASGTRRDTAAIADRGASSISRSTRTPVKSLRTL